MLCVSRQESNTLVKPSSIPLKPLSQPELHSLMLESLPEGVCCLDMQGNFTYLNRAAAQMLQVDPGEVLGRSFHETMHHSRLHSSSTSEDDCLICRNLRSEQGCFVNHEVFWRPNGSSFPAEYSAQPLRTESGDQGMILTFSDVTQRQMHAREMMYILSSAKCLLWYGDLQYVRSKQKIRWFIWPADPIAAQRFLPIPIAEGQSFAEAYYACRLDEDKGVSDDYGTQAVLEGRNYHQEYRCRRIDGEIRWIAEDVQVEPISEDRWRAVGVCTDITERKQREQEIAILNERLQRAIMETHHRVKNNLQIIVALIELQTIDRPQMLPLSEFKRLSLHVRSLAAIHDLLTAEIKTKGETESLSARSVLEHLLTTIAQTTGKTRLHYDLEDARLSNRQCASLALIANELIANALKHGREEIRLRFTTRDVEAVLEICDDGPGFPTDFSPRSAANTGLELIESLTRTDLLGQTRYENRREGGARVVVQFPLPLA